MMLVRRSLAHGPVPAMAVPTHAPRIVTLT